MDGIPDRTQGALLASLFSPVTLRELSRKQFGAGASRLAVLSELVRSNRDASLADAFDAAQALLARGYRSEYVFKNDIVSRAVFGRHSPRTASALIEQPMGDSIADVMVLNGTTTVYEVKTDLDDFSRLPTQLHDYCSRAEHVYVVTSMARAASNKDRLVPQHLFNMLRTAELQALLKHTDGYEPNPHQGQQWAEMQSLFAELPLDLAHTLTVKQLRRRSDAIRPLVTASTFPTSLRALAYATPMSTIGVNRVLHRLAQPATAFRIAA